MNPEILSSLVITDVYSSATIYTEKNKKTRRYNRPCWAIVIKYEGETEYISKGKSYVSDMNNIVILPKGCSYGWHCKQAGRFFIIEFECELTCNDIFCFSVDNGEKILKLFKDIEYKRTIRKPMYEIESIRDTYSILLMLAQQPMQKKYLPTEKHNKITPALDYITKNYTTDINNEELAELTGLSTVYFRKLFTEITGTSPMVFIRLLRIKKAKEMLKSDYGSISDIAQSLGYLNIYDFSRAFKKHVGVSPLNYKRRFFN